MSPMHRLDKPMALFARHRHSGFVKVGTVTDGPVGPTATFDLVLPQHRSLWQRSWQAGRGPVEYAICVAPSSADGKLFAVIAKGALCEFAGDAALDVRCGGPASVKSLNYGKFAPSRGGH